MLGPEQINLAVRPTPIFLEGLVSIQITEEAAKDLGLRDGQIVRGLIGMRGEELRLIINNREINWLVGSHLKVGDKVDLRVAINPRALQPLVTSAPPAPFAEPSQRLMSLLLRPPQSSPVIPLLMPDGRAPMLQQLAEGESARWLAQFMQSMAVLSPAQVRRALMVSGLFTEARVARQLGVPMDLKQILRIILRNTPPQSAMARELESAIDEIESRQVETLQSQSNRGLSYSFVLPFMDANPVQVQFERGASKDGDLDPDWVINLHTNSRILGELWLKTTYKPSLRLDMEVWAARADSARLARAGSSKLHHQLEVFGLALGKMTVHHARRPLAGSEVQKMMLPGGVVDITT